MEESYSRRNFSKPANTHIFIDRYIRELEILKEPRPMQNTGTGAVPRGFRRQKVPPVGYAKIHMDARVSTPSRGGMAAAVRRDDQGNYMGSSVLVVPGLQDPATLEAIACREGLALAEDLLVQNFVVGSDSKQVVRDIHKGNHGRYGTIVSPVQEFV